MKTSTILKDYQTKKTIIKNGDCETRYTPCSTFKIALALMGYDSKVLIDENNPKIEYNPKTHSNLAFIDSQRKAQTPKNWLKVSAIWYSKEILPKIGKQNLEKYLAMFNYGNQDAKNEGVFWIKSSLKISAQEQINFLENILSRKFPISDKSYEMLKKIMPVIEEDDWKIYGKTGTAFHSEKKQSGWFVGWAEKDSKKIIFAKHFEDMDIDYNNEKMVYASTLARDEVINNLKEV